MPAKSSLKNQIRGFISLSLLKFHALLPLRINHWLGSVLGRLIYYSSSRLRHVAMNNIQACFPDYSASCQHVLVKNSFMETGKTLTEAGPMWLWSNEKVLGLVRNVRGEELIREALDNGKGVILALPHLGNWEILGLYCSFHYPTTSLYKKPRMEQLDSLIRTGRERLGAHLVPTDNRGIRQLLKALNSQQLICVLPDQEPGNGNGVFAPFFNVPAYSMTLVSKLVQKTGAEVIMAYAKRLSHGQGYELHFSRAPEDIHAASLNRSVHSMNCGIEACIREVPEQYQWSYKRFRRRPEDTPLFYH